MTVPKLSALVVAHNEAAQLEACLSCLKFADEIVVVLDRNTDNSREIAATFGAKVIEGAWEIEGERRDAGQKNCTGDWIIEIDADERVSPALATEIRATLSKGPDWFRVPVDNYIGQRLVRYGWGAYFGVSAKIILFKRGMKSWGNQRVHPRVKMQGQGGGSLNERLAHYVDRDISDLLHRLDRYTDLNAADWLENGKSGTYSKNIWRIFGRFWKCYVLRKGHREGGLGLLIAICASLYPFVSYLKMIELKERKLH